MKERTELIGRIFGEFLILNFYGIKDRRSSWCAKCSCGNFVVRAERTLLSGQSWHCGCKRYTPEVFLKRKYPRSKMTWKSMHDRCNLENRKDYKFYGGKGIKVCERWRKFSNFLDDMGERPIGLTLDRIDGDGDYSPDNCRWSDITTQNRNRKINKITIDIANEIRKDNRSLSKIAKDYGVNNSLISMIKNNKIWKNQQLRNHTKDTHSKEAKSVHDRTIYTTSEYKSNEMEIAIS